MLLVCASPTTTTTLTEITDPAEVERLSDACQSGKAASPFQQVLDQFGGLPRDRRYAARHDPAELDFSHLEAAHSGRVEPTT